MVDLGWMAGRWTGEVWGGQMEEYWSAPVGGRMVGVNHLVREDAMPHREFLSIEPRGDALAMTVFVARSIEGVIEPTHYTLAENGESSAVFVNSEHVRLSKITYIRIGDAMEIRLEGERKGQPFLDEFVLTC